jgi:alkanesulfonate monooxygenase SsuD/methylene tetrahydromethanopterin reductase-like flavin-dependent oxidoreductase (luciferase family)
MKVFVFDLVPYDENLDYLKNGGKELPYPLPATHFKPEVAARVYAEHLDAWAELDRLGFDGVGFNEHHCSPYGLMNSPNLLAAAAAQRTKNIKLLIYGNLLPLHEPLRLAEELAVLDCMSNGRIISGFARGIPREYQVHNVPLPDSRPRFEEAMDILLRAWQEDIFSFEGQFWTYRDVALWPRPFQRPHPPVWMPITGSKETIEFAAKRNIPITPGVGSKGLLEDVIAYYDKCLIAAGHTPTVDSVHIPVDAYVADSKAQAIKEASPYTLYFNRTLFSHGNITETNLQRAGGYVSDASNDYVRPENLGAAARAREDYRDLDEAKLAKRAENMPWGTPDEVAERIIASAEHAGASTVLVSMNRGAMPHEMFMNQIRRFGTEVLPRLQAHQVTPRH